jgi:hypothetical protein
MVNIEQAKLDPAGVFKTPSAVLKNKKLTLQQKIDILQRWAYDERELAVAEEENMQPGNLDSHTLLDKILKALIRLGVNHSREPKPPTKQGG